MASSRGPGSLMAASAPLEKQEQLTVNSIPVRRERETEPQTVQHVNVEVNGHVMHNILMLTASVKSFRGKVHT